MKAKLEFKFQDWSGWAHDFHGEVSKIELEMSEGDRLSSDEVGKRQGMNYKDGSVAVTKVATDNVEVKFYEYDLGTFSRKGADGKSELYIPDNLGSISKDSDGSFITAVLKKNQIVKVASPATDMGFFIEVTLLDILE